MLLTETNQSRKGESVRDSGTFCLLTHHKKLIIKKNEEFVSVGETLLICGHRFLITIKNRCNKHKGNGHLFTYDARRLHRFNASSDQR